MRQLIGGGTLLVTLGISGFITLFLGQSANRALWQALEIFSETVSSIRFTSGLLIAIGISSILLGFGSEKYKQSKRNRY